MPSAALGRAWRRGKESLKELNRSWEEDAVEISPILSVSSLKAPSNSIAIAIGGAECWILNVRSTLYITIQFHPLSVWTSNNVGNYFDSLVWWLDLHFVKKHIIVHMKRKKKYINKYTFHIFFSSRESCMCLFLHINKFTIHILSFHMPMHVFLNMTGQGHHSFWKHFVIFYRSLGA